MEMKMKKAKAKEFSEIARIVYIIYSTLTNILDNST